MWPLADMAHWREYTISCHIVPSLLDVLDERFKTELFVRMLINNTKGSKKNEYTYIYRIDETA